MKLKVQHVMDATLTVTNIINERRAMPQKGKYRLARLHAKLVTEFATINAQRDEMIVAYQTHQTREIDDPENPGEKKVVEAEGWKVPEDKMPEFTAAWKVIGEGEIEVDVQPIPLAYLDLGDTTDGCITAGELITLGELVQE